jgi:4-carboxymuconolactone decarboxylase
MSRISAVTQQQFTEAQQRLFDAITQGKRGDGSGAKAFLTADGGLRGPFNAFMYSPAIGDITQQLGAAVRYGTSIPPRSRELAIIMIAADWRAEYEFWAHAKIARREGLPEHIIESIRCAEQPDFSDATESMIYRFVRELMNTRRVSDDLYKEAVQLIGETGVVELVILVGYYHMISMLLNVFEVSLPAGERSPFEAIEKESKDASER